MRRRPPDATRVGDARPAYYARSKGAAGDWWTLLHPPYTAWHLSYVVIGACLAPAPSAYRLGLALGAFFLAVGVSAHALDELNGRPLGTGIPRWELLLAAVIALVGALAIGVDGVRMVGWPLVVFMVVGPVVVVGYNAELFGGALHNDFAFAAGWGAFPVLTAYVFQTGSLSVAALLAAAAAVALSLAQRSLSTRARMLRRQTRSLAGHLEMRDGTVIELDQAFLLAPVERALRSSAWGVVFLAAALAVARFA